MNGLAHITIAGQQVGLKFGLPAVKRIMEKMVDHDMIQSGQYTELGITHIIYAGYLNHCIMNDEGPTIPFAHFYEQIEGLDDEQIKQQLVSAIRSFEDSKYVKRVIAANEEEKKKVTITTPNPSTGTESNLFVSENSDTRQANIAD